MNFVQILDVVRMKLGDPAKLRHQIEYLKFLVNQGQREICAETGIYKSSYTDKSVAGQKEYALRYLAPPATSPMLVAIAAGNLDINSSYYYKFTFYSSQLQTESTAVQSVQLLTTVVNRQAYLANANVPKSNDSRVDKVRVYRTEGNGSVFRYLTEFANPTVVDFYDYAADTTLGSAYESVSSKMNRMVNEVISVWWDTLTTNLYQIRNRVPYPQPSNSNDTGDPVRFYVYGDVIGFDPTPEASNVQFKIYFYGEPPKLIDDGDEPILPEAYKILLVYYALWHLLEEEGKTDQAEHYRMLVEKGKADIRGWDNTRGGPTRVQQWLL